MSMRVDSIWFNYTHSKAIDLRNEFTKKPLGKTPEWTRGGRNEAVAYVRGTDGIELGVSFSGFSGKKKVRVMAGSAQLGQQTVSTGTTEVFPVGKLSLKDAIAVNQVTLIWQVWVDRDKGGGTWVRFDSMTVTIYTTGGQMVENASEGLYTSVYWELVKWTCEWAKGLEDAKDICDALIKNLARSGLKYAPGAGGMRQLLLTRGGMCQAWARMFQYMAHCQGVFVYRRAFLVDWRQLANNEVMWAAIVSPGSGMNQTAPPVRARKYRDDDTAFPIVSSVPVNRITARRWTFWGSPNGKADGHVVNFLTVGKKLYLYDPSFGTGPFDIDMALPPSDGTILGGTQLTSFKKVYLNGTMKYMMGSLINGGRLYKAVKSPMKTGITVKTELIPDVISGVDQITFYWVQG